MGARREEGVAIVCKKEFSMTGEPCRVSDGLREEGVGGGEKRA